MRISHLQLHNFRGIRSLKFEFDPHMNVIAGVNGSGKSAILDCAAILLSRLTAGISSPKSGGRLYSEQDINNNSAATNNSIGIEFEGRIYHWNLAKTRPGRPHEESSVLSDVKAIAEIVQARLSEQNEASVPLAVFYPVNRAVLDIPLRIRGRHQFDQLAAYSGALTAQNNFRVFFEWYRDREDLENEQYRRYRESPLFSESPQHDRQLEAVRRAIPQFLPGFSNLHIKRMPLRMVVTKGNDELLVNQLSDGEKCMLAMVGDLARRLALANPSVTDPLHSAAVVLIDEIELHLHPGWQRRVIPALQATFPNCQFVLTTHSPQVVSEVPSKQIWVLDPQGTTAEHPRGAYGLDSNRILEDVMEVPERPAKVKGRLAELFRQIDENRLQEAQQTKEEIHSIIGDDPELTKAAVLIRRKEALGK